MMASSDARPPGSAAPRVSIATVLFNPFYYLAGGPALGLGLVLILLAGLIGFFSNTHFDGVIDFHTRRPAPLWFFLAEGVIDWLALALPLYLAGRLLSRSRGLRALDVFGTQALARAPYLLAALATLLPGYQRTNHTLLQILPQLVMSQNGTSSAMEVLAKNPADFAVFLAVVLFGLLMLIWMVALMVRAYAFSCNLKGPRAVVSFIVVVLIGEVISKIIIGLLTGR